MDDLPEPFIDAFALSRVCRRRRHVRFSRWLKLSFPACKERVDTHTDLSLDETAATSRSLELMGDAQMFGAPSPEAAHGLNADAGATIRLVEIS
jgi:hypothetical protein